MKAVKEGFSQEFFPEAWTQWTLGTPLAGHLWIHETRWRGMMTSYRPSSSRGLNTANGIGISTSYLLPTVGKHSGRDGHFRTSPREGWNMADGTDTCTYHPYVE